MYILLYIVLGILALLFLLFWGMVWALDMFIE